MTDTGPSECNESFFVESNGQKLDINDSANGIDIVKLQRAVGLPADEAKKDPEYGYADGCFGPKTFKAINAFLAAKGVAEFTDDTVTKSHADDLVGKGASVMGQGLTIFERSLTLDELFKVGDGVGASGATSIGAIRDEIKVYQSDKGREATGELGPEDWKELVAE